MNDKNLHLDDDAELYALGMLENEDRARIEAHLRDCDMCLQRVGRAEATVAAMTESLAAMPAGTVANLPRARRFALQPVLRQWGALAAALLLAVSTGVLGVQNASLQSAERGRSLVLGAMVRSHFAHAQFATASGTPVDAKVVYERHGRWYSVLAVDPQPGVQVALLRKDGTRILMRPLSQRDGVCSLMLRAPGDVARFVLVDARGAAIASARPVLAAPDAANRGSGAVALNR